MVWFIINNLHLFVMIWIVILFLPKKMLIALNQCESVYCGENSILFFSVKNLKFRKSFFFNLQWKSVLFGPQPSLRYHLLCSFTLQWSSFSCTSKSISVKFCFSWGWGIETMASWVIRSRFERRQCSLHVKDHPPCPQDTCTDSVLWPLPHSRHILYGSTISVYLRWNLQQPILISSPHPVSAELTLHHPNTTLLQCQIIVNSFYGWKPALVNLTKTYPDHISP